MRNKEINLIWQTRNELPAPTNALQELREILTRTARDCSEDKMMACIYGIVVGWDDESYSELKQKHEWDDEVVCRQKMLHENYNYAWNTYMRFK